MNMKNTTPTRTQNQTKLTNKDKAVEGLWVCCVGKVDGSNHSDKEGIFGQVGLRRERKDMHYEMIKTRDLSAMMSFSFIIYYLFCMHTWPNPRRWSWGPWFMWPPILPPCGCHRLCCSIQHLLNQCCSCLLIIAACGGSFKDIEPKVPQYLY